ncbi:unnamed protein product [marine sediment metagenome]|uniref:Uncharacterized protein n=1 Tax=marine sediment metagenome TaxID=412755 RepID=X1HMN8_9ZZZZ
MKLKIDFSRQGNFILAVLLIHFVFFGYISNVYEKTIGNRVLFLYQVLFNPISILSLFILIAIVFILGFREQFFEYGIKNSIWLIPVIVIESWIWYMFINSFQADLLELFGTLLLTYFVSFEAYLTIFILLGINILSAILGTFAKRKYKEYLAKIKEVEL